MGTLKAYKDLAHFASQTPYYDTTDLEKPEFIPDKAYCEFAELWDKSEPLRQELKAINKEIEEKIRNNPLDKIFRAKRKWGKHWESHL